MGSRTTKIGIRPLYVEKIRSQSRFKHFKIIFLHIHVFRLRTLARTRLSNISPIGYMLEIAPVLI